VREAQAQSSGGSEFVNVNAVPAYALSEFRCMISHALPLRSIFVSQSKDCHQNIALNS
jgi:hypothetical protein